jgi:hypothetical protein
MHRVGICSVLFVCHSVQIIDEKKHYFHCPISDQFHASVFNVPSLQGWFYAFFALILFYLFIAQFVGKMDGTLMKM